MPQPQPAPQGDWTDHAACREANVNAWYPPHPYVPAALAVCQGCPVIDACADHGLRHERFGIWGGMTESERRRLRRKQGIPEPPLVTIAIALAPSVCQRPGCDEPLVQNKKGRVRVYCSKACSYAAQHDAA